MEIITDFVHNYKRSLDGLHILVKILVTLALAFIIFGVISAVVNVIA
ncbi:hypothetical protein [Christiangramia fulva]|nr:hypothetical protein [Christiangramia fulva]